MAHKRITQFNQQRQREASQESGILQRAAVRSVSEAQVQSTEDNEAQPLVNSALSKNFSRVSISTTKPQQIMAKLMIGPVGDKYEQEADRVAAQVMQQINAPASMHSGEDETVQPEEMETKDNKARLMRSPILQRRSSDGGMAATPDLEASINRARGGGRPMENNVRKRMEQGFGADFSGVKIHTDAQSDQLNQSIKSLAFTTGQDVFFRQGVYAPTSRGGQELLAHELTHVVQQKGGKKQQTEQPQGSGQMVQRYTTEKTTSGKLYNVSENRKVIVGIDYPNHDLFVAEEEQIQNMNEIAKNGLLKFVNQGTQSPNFPEQDDQPYHKVYPIYKDDAPLSGNRLYKLHLRKDQEKWMGRETMKNTDINIEADEKLIKMYNTCESLRKLIVQTDAHQKDYVAAKNYNSSLIENLTNTFKNFYKKIKEYMEGNGSLEEVSTQLINTLKQISVIQRNLTFMLPHETPNSDGRPGSLIELKNVLEEMKNKANALQKDLTTVQVLSKNSLLISHHNEVEQKLNEQSDNTLILPGCDLTAATIVGEERHRREMEHRNKTGNLDLENITEEISTIRGTDQPNDQQMKFILGEGNTHHFATPLLSDGSDYVTMEGFAKPNYEAHDNRWEFIMYGRKGEGEEDNLETFNRYTKSRYNVMGLNTDSSYVKKGLVGRLHEKYPKELRNELKEKAKNIK